MEKMKLIRETAIWALLAVTHICSVNAHAQGMHVQELRYAVLQQNSAGVHCIVSPTNRLDDPNAVTLTINRERTFQTMEGFGGAFTEIGGEALSSLGMDARAAVMSNLFDQANGARFSFCRIPIGGNDFALSAYSLNDTDNDYDMDHFSIKRDQQYLLPFVKEAQKINPHLKFHACPWSPPAWLKTNHKMTDGGQLIDDPHAYAAYATYLRKFIQAYAVEGISIDRLFVQNEPNREEKYPSCLIPPKQMTHFVVDYLHPELEKNGLSTRIWAGTFQENKSLYAHECLANKAFSKIVSGVGFQYSDTRMIQDVRLLAPWLPVMHTESDCFDGSNNALQAKQLFQEITHYLEAGCTVFTYWNMISNERQRSSWDWKQNSLMTIDRKSKAVSRHPDFAVMSLVSHMIRPGALRCEAFSSGRSAPLAFINLDGSVVLLFWSEEQATSYQVLMDREHFSVDFPPHTLCGLRILSEI